MGQIRGLLRRGHPWQPSHRCRATRAPLVKQQHAVFAQRIVKPTWRAGTSRRSHRLKARAALQKDKEWPVRPSRIGDLPCEHLNGLTLGIGVVDRHLHRMLDADQSRDTNLRAHPSIMHARPIAGSLRHRSLYGSVIGGYTRDGDAEPGSRCKSDTVLATVTRELEPHVATGPTGLGRRGESARPGSQETACIVV